MIKSALKTTLKKFEITLTGGNKEVATAAFTKAGISLDMAASKGVIHKNMAARKKSRLALKLNALSA